MWYNRDGATSGRFEGLSPRQFVKWSLFGVALMELIIIVPHKYLLIFFFFFVLNSVKTICISIRTHVILL